MEINGIDESAYSAHLLRDYKITALPVESEYWQGRNRSSFNLLTQKYGLKKLSLPVAFDGANREKVTLNKSRFDSALWGKVEIYLPNGFFYTCILDSAGELEYDGEEHGRASYELIGMQHKARVTVKSSTFSCSSTVPFTDCIITGTTTGTSGSIGAITFSGLTSGKVVVVDGINKRFLYDGAPDAQDFVWINFPYLVPGENTILTTGLSGVEIQYDPTFM